jgi:hypothetical protein
MTDPVAESPTAPEVTSAMEVVSNDNEDNNATLPLQQAAPPTSQEAQAEGSGSSDSASEQRAPEASDYILGIDFGSEECVLTITRKGDSVLPSLVRNSTSQIANSYVAEIDLSSATWISPIVQCTTC